MGEDEVERPRHVGEIECFDYVACIADLSTAAAPHEAAELLLERLSTPLGLLLQRAQPSEISVCLDHVQYDRWAKGADQLVLEVRDTDVKTERLHLGARE